MNKAVGFMANIEAAKFALDQHSLVSMTDLKGNIVYANSKFIEISGYSEGELLSTNHRLLNSGNQPKDYWRTMYLTVSKGTVWHDEVKNIAKDGHEYWVDTTIVPNYEDDKLIGYISIRTDITEQKGTIVQLAKAKKAAEVANVSKSSFLANMSHEIRTPMNGVIGMTNLLLQSGLTPEQYKLAETVKSSGETLLGIINDILDFSKVDADKLELEILDFNLGQLLEDLGSTLSYQTDIKRLQLICPANPIINEWVKGDPGRIRQILTNLIGNAIKFTDHGEIAIFVEVKEKSSSIKQYSFKINDTGIGIHTDQQKHLFDKFSQADNSTTRQYGGTGLGLSISKKLVELMKGEIGVESSEGNGSTFWFTLELETAQNKNKTSILKNNLHHQKILIVDDNKTNLELMHQLHVIWGLSHTLVKSGKEAIQELNSSASNEPYTIAIIDMNMPEMNGIDLCKNIRSNAHISDINLIMVTSQAQRGDATKMKTIGFNGYLTKPINQSELYDILMQASGLIKDSHQLITRHTHREQQHFKAHVLVVEDNITNQLVIGGLLKALGVSVDLAANGQEALTTLQQGSYHDLIFMDCQMPIMDGYVATAKIRDAKIQIPIIAMTANAMPGDKKKCLDIGMNDYLSKPIDPEKVTQALAQWLPNESNNNTQTPYKELKEDTKTQADLIFDFEDMSNRLMHKKDLMLMVFEQLKIDLKNQTQELNDAIQQNNLKQVAALGHKIKGASVNVGGIAVSNIAHKIEKAGKTDDLELIKSLIPLLNLAIESLLVAMANKLS